MIAFAKFFQPVEIPTGQTSKNPTTSVSSQTHDLTLEGNFLRIVNKIYGTQVLATIFNICYLREEPDADAKPTQTAPKPSKQKRESDSLV